MARREVPPPLKRKARREVPPTLKRKARREVLPSLKRKVKSKVRPSLKRLKAKFFLPKFIVLGASTPKLLAFGIRPTEFSLYVVNKTGSYAFKYTKVEDLKKTTFIKCPIFVP